MEDLIICTDIVKQHRARGLGGDRKGFRAVDRVSLSIPRNSIFGLVGESGCGKTTLARAVLWLDPPTSGKVLFDGTDLGSLKKAEMRKFRKRMQIVFQDPNNAMDPKMTVYDSLCEGLVNLRVPPREREEKIKTLLDHVGISFNHRTRYPHEFSGGQKQRIVIARALSMDPDFLLLDEPVSNLDVSIQAQIINLLMDLKEEYHLTYLFISHDLNLVSYLADRTAVMYRGRIVEQGETEGLVAAPLHPYTVKLFSSVPGAKRTAGAGILAAGDKTRAGETATGTTAAAADTPPEPRARFGRSKQRQPAQPAVSSAAQPSGGCPYYPNCGKRIPACLERAPELSDTGSGHLVSCINIS